MQSSWSFGLKLSFRFFFIYFILYTFGFPIIWDGAIVWIAQLFFGVEISVPPNSSGDTTWNYVQVFLFAVISVSGSLIWSLIDRQRPDYKKLYFWLTVLVRYYLASTMISYGVYKIIKSQFPFPHLARLIQPYGDSSPMGLLWTFMGYSTAYNFYAGMAEAVGGFLLFFRRTRLLGALICIGVMSNVVMLNFTYDVPVKLLSMHLLFMAFFLAAPDAIRLLNVFVLNRPIEPETIQPLFKGTKWFYPYVGIKTLFIGFVVITLVVMASGQQRDHGESAQKPELYGIYEVEKYAINGDTLPPVLNDTRRWKRIFVDNKEWITVEYMDNAKMYYRFESDTLKRHVGFQKADSSALYKFTYQRENGHILWQGGNENDSFYVEMTKRNPRDFLLVNRGFNWINEYPFNR